MPLGHNVSTVWKDCTIWHNVNGTWKKCALWHNVNGTWKQITALLGATLPSTFSLWDFAIAPTNATTSLGVNSDGSYDAYQGGSLMYSGTWRQGGASSDYQVRLTKTSGNNPTGAALATWIACSSGAAWYINETRDGYFSNAFTGTLEIRLAASPNTVLATASVSMSADVEV
jgi:hypothetical protein